MYILIETILETVVAIVLAVVPFVLVVVPYMLFVALVTLVVPVALVDLLAVLKIVNWTSVGEGAEAGKGQVDGKAGWVGPIQTRYLWLWAMKLFTCSVK